MKAISPLISAIILIALVFAIASIMSPWAYQLVIDVTNQTSTSTDLQVKCQNTAYDFDTSFASNGINYSFSATDYLEAMILNTGKISLHGFSFEVTLPGPEIKQISATNQRTGSSPLKPGQSMILRANVTEDLSGTPTEIRVLNSVCPTKHAKWNP